MAGDWIKMRSDLFTHPKVVRMSSALKADTLRIVGGLMSVWCLFDAHSVDGTLEGYTVDAIDNLLRWDGFAQAMISVGWMINNGESLELPSFDTHNGASAKRRAQDADRKREGRKVPKTSAVEADKLRTREEKRREESNTPLTPQGGISGKRSSKPKAPKIGIDEFIAQCREAGEKPIQPDDPIFGYLQRIGLPEEYGALAWEWFKRRYASNMQAGVRGWRQTFRNAVEGNWPRYWFQADDGTWQLTTAGKQAQADYEAMQRQERAA